MFKNLKFLGAGRETAPDEFRQMARAVRAADPERLSPAARATILSEATRAGASPRPFSALFPPTLRAVTAAGLPVAAGLLLAAVIGRAPVEAPGAPERGAPAAVVQVAKVGDEVRFTIANGRRSHHVYRSEAPDRFEGRGFRVTDGAYADRLDDGSTLVFYRIE